MSLNWNNTTNSKTFGFNRHKLDYHKSRFYALYFLDNLTGSLLLSNQYSDNSCFSSNEDLISGFLTALNLFIKEIKPGEKDEEIQEINFKETRLLYERRGRLLVIAISKKTNLQIEREILRQIVQDFYTRFEQNINRFNGIIDPSILNYKKRLEDMNLNNLIKFKP